MDQFDHDLLHLLGMLKLAIENIEKLVHDKYIVNKEVKDVKLSDGIHIRDDSRSGNRDRD